MLIINIRILNGSDYELEAHKSAENQTIEVNPIHLLLLEVKLQKHGNKYEDLYG